MPRNSSKSAAAAAAETPQAEVPAVEVQNDTPQVVESTDGAPAAESTTSGAGRGRPRPQLTLERDQLVANKMAEYALDQPWTKEDVAKEVGLEPSVVGHCLNRLEWAGVVDKAGRGKFTRAADANGQPVPYSSVYIRKPERGAKRGAPAEA